MGPYFVSGPVTLWHGDCIEVMRQLPDASVDAVVTDPPYGLEFMGCEWDGADGFRRSLNEADAGRENVFGRTSAKAPEYRTDGKMLGQVSQNWADKATHSRGYADHNPNAFQAWSQVWATEAYRLLKPGGHMLAFGGTRTWHRLVVAIEDAGFEIRDSIAWMYGSGFPKAPTVLKPAFEPIAVARKPLIGTVAANVLLHGTGALNIDGSRIGAPEAKRAAGTRRYISHGKEPGAEGGSVQAAPHDGLGRWPANVILDESQALALDQQSGNRPSSGGAAFERGGYGGTVGLNRNDRRELGYGDNGGASRFFYTAKASANERPSVDGTSHPTVKPVDLMRWLVRLVTPTGGTVLEPFAGSGTTVEACVLEGFSCIAIEREDTYLPLILNRIRKPHHVGLDFGDWDGAA